MRNSIRVLLLVALFFTILPKPVAASAGLPNSAEFGYGARIDIWGQNVLASVDLAANLGLDWIGLEFNWNRLWPDASNPPDLALWNQVIERTKLYNLSIILSITSVPAWANTPQGPDPNITSSLLINLIRMYSGAVQAIELFPGANTVQGWNNVPNPKDYLTLLETVDASLRADGFDITIITTLFPVDSQVPSGDLEDVSFLEYFYQSGATDLLPVIGIYFNAMLGDPMSVPNSADNHFLRHYEEIRALMLNNNHQQGIIWITGFTWPSPGQSHSSTEEALPATVESQAEWLYKAYSLLKGQLYIGAAFFSWLNPPAGDHPNQNSLFLPDSSLHPAGAQLHTLINGTNISATNLAIPDNSPSMPPPESVVSDSIQGEDSLVLVKYSNKIDLKHFQP